MLESIIYEKIIPFLRPLISDTQFGFMSNRSCLTNLLSTHYLINKAIDEKKSCDLVFLDFQKAFDSVAHNELLYKLWRIGITGNLWMWFREYLSNRRHQVQIGDQTSDPLPVISGVPQGSVLGPLLFLIFINDIPVRIKRSSLATFADDTKIWKEIACIDDETELQRDLLEIQLWCDEWNLHLNASKCSVMRLSLRESKESTYSVNGMQISTVSTYKDLGVTTTSNLSWSSHILAICRSAYMALNLLRRNVPEASTSIGIRKRLYLALVRSQLSYCSQLWRPRLMKDIVCLEKVQRRASKYILGDRESDYRSRLITLNLLPLMYWLELQDLIFCVKSLQSPSDNFNIRNYVQFSTSSTRSSGCKLLYKTSCSSTTRHFYLNRIVLLWNASPPIDISLSLVTTQ